MQLELKEIEVTYTSSKDLREAEADENNETIRKNFTVEEIAEIDEFFREREEAEAKERQKRKPKSNFVSEQSLTNMKVNPHQK